MTELSPPNSRRDEFLELAATMFAERGLRATTVRDIADSAGILSGSLYHHFSSKEEMVDEVLRDFLDWLFARYEEIVDTRIESAGAAQGLVHGVVRGDRAPARAGRHLSGRSQAAVCLSPGSPTSRTATTSSARCGWTCSTRASRKGTSGPTSTSTWSTGSSATPPGCRSAGISPADRSPPNRSVEQYLAIVLGGITKEGV